MLLSNGNGWCSRVLRKPERPVVEWVRLGGLGNPECSIGLLRNGAWVVDTAAGLADLNESESLTFVLRLLLLHTSEIRECLGSFLHEADLDPNLVNSFPFVRLLMRGVERGGYWAEHSIEWIEQVTIDDQERLTMVDGLKQIESNKDNSQKLRHKAMKHRIRLERDAK